MTTLASEVLQAFVISNKMFLGGKEFARGGRKIQRAEEIWGGRGERHENTEGR